MKSLFKKIKINKPNKNIEFVKKHLKKLPLEQRQLLANQMWFGTEIKNLPLPLKPFKVMFEDANKNAIGKAWEQLEQQTNDYIQGNLTHKEEEEYKTKLIKETYKEEPDKLSWLQQYFETPLPDSQEFKKIILEDIKKSKAKAFQEHLEFWGCLND